MVTEVFGELFFASVWSGKASLNRYLRNGGSPNLVSVLSDGKGVPAQVISVQTKYLRWGRGRSSNSAIAGA
jgi:hypothetical protein